MCLSGSTGDHKQQKKKKKKKLKKKEEDDEGEREQTDLFIIYRKIERSINTNKGNSHR
jgi:hypothetical protein